jgi:hypothetical protein
MLECAEINENLNTLLHYDQESTPSAEQNQEGCTLFFN